MPQNLINILNEYGETQESKASTPPFSVRHVALSPLLITLVTLCFAVSLYYIDGQRENFGNSVRHTRIVEDQINEYKAAINHLYLTQRNYLLTGKAQYLDELKTILANDHSEAFVSKELQELHELTLDNPVQRENISRLEKTHAHMMAYFKDFAARPPSLSDKSTKTDYAETDLDEINAIVRGMKQIENKLLVSRMESHDTAKLYNRLLMIASTLAFYLSVITLVTVLSRYINERHRLERKAANIMRNEHNRIMEIVSIQRDVALAHHDLEEAMRIITERTMAITQAEGAVVEMLDGDDMLYKAASGVTAQHVGFRLPAGASISGLCVKQNAVLKCDDADTDPRVNKEACRTIGVSSMVVVPLVNRNQPVGVLKVLSSQKHAFSDKHVATLEVMAGVLSAAMADAIANENLRQSEETFRSALEYSAIGMALVSTEGKFLKVNNALCDMLGYSSDELLKIDFQTITHPEDLKEDLAYVERMLNRQINTYQMEKRYFHKDGHTIWILLSGSLVWNTDDTPKYFIAQIQDITSRHNLMQKVIESNTELERFAYVASHDLQEPLRMITNFSEIISKDYAAKLDDEGREYLGIIIAAGRRMRSMISDLLNYSRIENESIELKECNGAEILDNALHHIKALADDAKAVITYDTLPVLNANPIQLTRVIQNFISNGIKYQPQGNTPRIHIGVEDKGKEWCIYIKDNGIGIAQEYQKQIFEPFRRLHRWDSIKGTGLGLPICKKIIENHHGKLWLTSVTGSGSTFYFTLPKKTVALEAA